MTNSSTTKGRLEKRKARETSGETRIIFPNPPQTRVYLWVNEGLHSSTPSRKTYLGCDRLLSTMLSTVIGTGGAARKTPVATPSFFSSPRARCPIASYSGAMDVTRQCFFGLRVVDTDGEILSSSRGVIFPSTGCGRQDATRLHSIHQISDGVFPKNYSCHARQVMSWPAVRLWCHLISRPTGKVVLIRLARRSSPIILTVTWPIHTQSLH